MIKIHVCEDEFKYLYRIKSEAEKCLILKYYDMEIGVATENPYELMDYINETDEIGIYFLDINLNSTITGFDIAKAIRKKDALSYIIFITSDADLLQFTFKYKCQALDFVLKSEEKNLPGRIWECLTAINNLLTISGKITNKVFTFKTNGLIGKEHFSNIVMFEIKAGNIHKVGMYSIDRIVYFRASLKDVLAELDDRFMKCSSSCIINTDMIRTIIKKERMIILQNGQTVFGSTRCMKPIVQRLQKDGSVGENII